MINKLFFPTITNSKIAFLTKLTEMPIIIAIAIEALQFLILWIPIKGILKESDIKNVFTPKNNMEKNLWFYISTKQMSEFSEIKLVDNIFVDLIGSNPNHKLTIINSSTPKIVNNHLQYAITWAILGLLFLVMNYIYSKRH